MLARQVGAESTSLCTWVKHLPNLLRNTAESTPAFIKIGDQKVQRTLRKQKVRGLLQHKKVPGISVRNRATTAPGPPLPGLLQDSWERAGLTAPSTAKQGLSSTMRDLIA